MKLLISLAFVLILLVATTIGQRQCPQRIGRPSCVGVRDVGATCPTAPPRRLWYYSAANRTCVPMQHLGCGGNSNRWCTRRACVRRCARPTTTG